MESLNEQRSNLFQANESEWKTLLVFKKLPPPSEKVIRRIRKIVNQDDRIPGDQKEVFADRKVRERLSQINTPNLPAFSLRALSKRGLLHTQYKESTLIPCIRNRSRKLIAFDFEAVYRKGKGVAPARVIIGDQRDEPKIFFKIVGFIKANQPEEGDRLQILIKPNRILFRVEKTDLDFPNESLDELCDILKVGQSKPYAEPITPRPKLIKQELIKNIVELYKDGKHETSICIQCGYSTDDIGVFRRAVARELSVRVAPLEIMIDSSNIASKEEVKFIYIDRERIRSHIELHQLRRDSAFRKRILATHGTICSVCSMKIKDLIEAAHIKAVKDGGTDKTSNGIPLCANHHLAFDKGYWRIDMSSKKVVINHGLKAVDLGITKEFIHLDISED